MPSKTRRVNDAQVERLLAAMQRDVDYRSALAKRIVEREGYQTGSTDYKRRYKSTMRRFQRYVTEAGEKRSFARAPVEYQREVRQEARAVSVPAPAPTPRELEPETRGKTVREIEYEEFEPGREIHLNDIRALIAYYDGDVAETARAMNLNLRGEQLLDLAIRGMEVQHMRGGGPIVEGARFLLDNLPDEDLQDIQDFHDFLMDAEDWKITVLFGDLEDGYTTFSDWLDAWRNDGMDSDASQSEMWALWREAYTRSKK
jgi:hypothetical protein